MKIVEKIVSLQLMTKQIIFQSGSRLGFSNETALVALVVEQWQNWDGRGASIFVLLDLSMISRPLNIESF